MIKKINGYFADSDRQKYGAAFFLALLMSLIAIIGFVIAKGGVLTLYADYNYQQIPFYYHAHEMVRNGSFMWDFSTDLGTDFVESYSFYLLGSPFFWLTVPFPNEAVVYLMPFLLCLKTAVASLTAYAYIQGFVKNKNAALIGAFLYAFSGFQLTNLFFNHFHDAVAFFPLILLASDMLMREKKKGLFAAAVALCALTNYFFFAGMAVFTVIYFAVNILVGRYKFTVKSFANYATEAIIGVVCAAVILLPSAAAVLANNRATNIMKPADMLVYFSDPFIYLYILKGFFVFPEMQLSTSFPISYELDCASVSAYLPMISMCGVIGYFFLKKKKDMPQTMFIICVIMMLVPVLNSVFYMLNGRYYARWFYMPVLIMCVMSAITIDEDTRALTKGMIPSIIVPVLYLIAALISKAAGVEVNLTSIVICSVVAIGSLLMLYTMFTNKSITENSQRIIGILKRTSICCTAFLALMIFMNQLAYPSANDYIDGTILSKDNIESIIKDTQEDKNQYFRVDLCAQYKNRNLMWDMSSCTSFISIVNSSIVDFYNEIGFGRNVSSDSLINYYSLRSLFSVKYFIDMPIYRAGELVEPKSKLYNEIYSFDYLDTVNGMHIYENNCYIPMGFTYDYYTTAEALDVLDNKYFHSQAVLEAIVLDDEQIEKYGADMSEYDVENSKYDYEHMSVLAAQKRENACEYLHNDNDGFEAKITLDEPKLVFFSIPYDEDWKAQINGNDTLIEKVNYGFMAVYCDSGENVIRFDYRNKETVYGAYISIGGISILIVYIIISKKRKAKEH